jgi:outer membrane protein assembly factor BamB
LGLFFSCHRARHVDDSVVKKQKLLLRTMAILVCASLAHAENWPQFRGPTGQSVSGETHLPLNWSATENIAWKTSIPGESWSSPIIWGDQVFVTTATEGGANCRVLSLDRKTGGILWNKVVFQQTPPHKEGRNTYATPTPATDGERVYACFADGSFAALDLAGEIRWTNRDYPFYSQHGLATSPILHRGMLIMARDGSSQGQEKVLGWQKPWDQGFIVALDVQTGKERWKARRGSSRISHGVPTLWEHDGKEEIVSEAGDVVQGFDAQTGERLWSNEVIGEGKVPSTVVGGDLVFTAGGWGGKESTKAFRLGGRGDLKETQLIWEQKKGMPKVPSLLYWKPYLFEVTDNGLATCLKAATGEIVWQERLGGNFSASPVFADGRVYFLGDNGETSVVAAGPEFKVLAKNPLGEKVQASMAVSQGRFLIRTERNLICIGSK